MQQMVENWNHECKTLCSLSRSLEHSPLSIFVTNLLSCSIILASCFLPLGSASMSMSLSLSCYPLVSTTRTFEVTNHMGVHMGTKFFFLVSETFSQIVVSQYCVVIRTKFCIFLNGR